MIDINNIIRFLDDWSSDEGLISPFINSIMHDRYEYKDDSIYVRFPYCESFDEQKFWKSHIKNYQHLYVYSFLYHWAKESSLNSIISRLNSFKRIHEDDIVTQMKNFLCDYTNIPQRILLCFAFLVDEYFWDNDKIVPQGVSLIKSNSAFESYNDYSTLFMRTIESVCESVIYENIDLYLNYCKKIDLKGFSVCFCALLNKLAPIDYEVGISDALIAITKPIEGRISDKCSFNLQKKLLDFSCEHHNLYNISEDVIIAIIFNIVCNRIKEYILSYRLFLDEEKCVEFFEDRNAPYYLALHMTRDDVLKWQQKAFPWNFVNYYLKNSLKSLDIILDEVYGDIHKECAILVEDVIKQARKKAEKYGGIRDWTKRNLKEHTENYLNSKKEMLKERLINHLIEHKADVCFEIIDNAINDVCTTDYIRQNLENSCLEEKTGIEFRENINKPTEHDNLHSTITIKNNSNILFSLTLDRREARRYFDTINSSLSTQYYELISKARVSENIFGGSTSFRDKISNDTETKCKELIANYKRELKNECAIFIRNYLDYEYIVYRDNRLSINTLDDTSNESIWDDKDYTDNWLWDHGF